LEGEIAAIGDLSRDELTARWVKAYGCAPPKGVKRGLLERSASWHLQARRLGGHAPNTMKFLRAIDPHRGQGSSRSKAADAFNAVGSDIALVSPSPSTPPTGHLSATRHLPVPPKTGSRLMREWNGRMHIVEVIDNGFVLDGKTYRSLSAVARRITGAHWSGPRFFGL